MEVYRSAKNLEKDEEQRKSGGAQNIVRTKTAVTAPDAEGNGFIFFAS